MNAVERQGFFNIQKKVWICQITASGEPVTEQAASAHRCLEY